MRKLARQGTSLIEALVALLLGLVVVQGALTAAARTRVVHHRIVERAEVLSSVRLAAWVLRAEVEGGLRPEDWTVVDDALPLRAFRGTGLVCSAGSTADGLVVSWAGYRRPDPEKDSVWIANAMGSVSVVGLEGIEGAPEMCGTRPLEDGLMLRLSDAAPADAAVARVFERGAYSVTNAALRYRRGAGGRQPLTAEVFDDESGWRVDGAVLDLELIEREAAGAAPPPRHWRVRLARAPE